MIEVEGIAVNLVTGAGTGSLVYEATSGVFGELQPGSFLFTNALFVKTQVISSSLHHAVCDASHKSDAIDSGLSRVHALTGESGLEYFNGGDEHGILRPVRSGTSVPTIGETL